MTTPKKEGARAQLSVVPFGDRFAVELRTTLRPEFGGGTERTVLATEDTVEVAIQRAQELQEQMLKLGAWPAAGVS